VQEEQTAQPWNVFVGGGEMMMVIDYHQTFRKKSTHQMLPVCKLHDSFKGLLSIFIYKHTHTQLNTL
jgi:hypothetical protein